MWLDAKSYLRKAVRKDFVLHTRNVVKAMEMILEKEEGDAAILIPAAIVHDVGWSAVPLTLQKELHNEYSKKAERMHIECVPQIVEKILRKNSFDESDIKRIIEIILAHKFQDPKEHEKRLLIDADTLSDIFKDQLESDAKAYKNSPEEELNLRKEHNTFYTKTAREIFDREYQDRLKEQKSSQN